VSASGSSNNPYHAIILKDVLGESLVEIAALLDLSVDAVKGLLARGRARLRETTRKPARLLSRGRRLLHWFAMSRCSTNGTGTAYERCWPTTSNSIKSTYPLRAGRADVGVFFTIYAQCETVHLVLS